MNTNAVIDRREFYRIAYTDADHPTLEVDGRPCRVHDCSERGLRFAPGAGARMTPGKRVRGQLRFGGGEATPVDGVVVWAGDGMVALRLDGAGIPFTQILSEQRRLLSDRWR